MLRIEVLRNLLFIAIYPVAAATSEPLFILCAEASAVNFVAHAAAPKKDSK